MTRGNTTMKEYKEPEMEIIEIDNDVITTSGNCCSLDTVYYETETM